MTLCECCGNAIDGACGSCEIFGCAGARESIDAWNTCPSCFALVDCDEVHDGSERLCGCGIPLVVVEHAALVPEFGLEYDGSSLAKAFLEAKARAERAESLREIAETAAQVCEANHAGRIASLIARAERAEVDLASMTRSRDLYDSVASKLGAEIDALRDRAEKAEADLREVDMMLGLVGADRDFRRRMISAERERMRATERERGEARAKASEVPGLTAALDEARWERDVILGREPAAGRALAEIARLVRERDEARAERGAATARTESAENEREDVYTALRTVAHAVGVCHCHDFGCAPGSTDEILAEVTRLQGIARTHEERSMPSHAMHRRAQAAESRAAQHERWCWALLGMWGRAKNRPAITPEDAREACGRGLTLTTDHGVDVGALLRMDAALREHAKKAVST